MLGDTNTYKIYGTCIYGFPVGHQHTSQQCQLCQKKQGAVSAHFGCRGIQRILSNNLVMWFLNNTVEVTTAADPKIFNIIYLVWVVSKRNCPRYSSVSLTNELPWKGEVHCSHLLLWWIVGRQNQETTFLCCLWQKTIPMLTLANLKLSFWISRSSHASSQQKWLPCNTVGKEIPLLELNRVDPLQLSWPGGATH